MKRDLRGKRRKPIKRATARPRSAKPVSIRPFPAILAPRPLGIAVAVVWVAIVARAEVARSAILAGIARRGNRLLPLGQFARLGNETLASLWAIS